MARLEFLKRVRKRSFISEFVYAVLNIALAVAVLLAVRYTESIWLGILLVTLSKWRVLAVRPRYWWANLRSNLVDFIVSVSYVLQMHILNTTLHDTRSGLYLQIGLMLAYIGWLLWVKPRSRRSYMAAQAGIALFFGSAALFTLAYSWPVSVVVLGMWLLGTAATWHILSSYSDEVNDLFLSLAWGLVIAEISWVGYHWAIAYPLPVVSSLMLPQTSLIVLLVCFLAYKTYDSFYHHAKVRATDILLPLLFTLSVLLVLFLLFNRVGTAI